MPTTANTINYYIAADGTLRDGQAGSIAQTPRIYYGTEYAVTLSFPPSTIAEGDQLQVAVNRSRTFFSSASATGDAPVAAVAKHDVTAAEADAQAVTLTLSTNTRAMIDQVNGIDHPVRGFFGVHVLRGQSFVTLAVADAFMMSVESGPDAISPSLPVVDYPTREEAEQIKQDTITAQGKAEEAQGKAEEAQGKAEEAQGKAETAQGKAEDAQEAAETSQGKAEDAQEAAETAQEAAVSAKDAAQTAQANAEKIAEGSDADVAPLGLEHSAKGWAQEAAATLANKRDILQTLVTSSSTALEVEAGKSYNWTVSAASTIALATADKVAGKETRIDIYIDLQDGGSVSGDGVTVADAVLQSGWYKLIWDGTNATLYSTKAGGAASVVTIPAATTTYTLQDNKHYQQVPSAVPTYTLPTATMDGLVHEITVLVDFLHVTSCSFVDSSGVPVTLQSAISPQIGDAYIFRCYWYGKWRVVPLKIRNAATASSATGVVEVSDAVAGDALALKMTAPRSVVVNQLAQNGNFVDGTNDFVITGSNASVSNNICSLTYNIATNTNRNISYVLHTTASHVCIVTCEMKDAGLSGSYAIFVSSGSTKYITALTSGTWNRYSLIFTSASNTPTVYFALFNGNVSDTRTVELRNVQVVDLTQYFNGDSALIDSITSWDDLVAYDPRFASYVEYNTGTVEGVQPTVKVTGKNLQPKATETRTVSGVTFAPNEDGSITVSGTPTTEATYSTPRCYFKQGSILTASGISSATNIIWGSLLLYDKDGNTLYNSGGISSNRITVDTSLYPTAEYMVLRFKRNSNNVAVSGKLYPQVELGSVATAYEPYFDGGSVTAPSAMYGAGSVADTFDALAGKTGVKFASVDLGTLKWAWNASGTYGYWASSGVSATIARPSSNAVKANVIADKFGVLSHSNLNGSEAKVGNLAVSTGGGLVANTGSTTDKPSGMLYYELATPTTSTSTPAQIALQAGSNVVTQTDGGRTLGELSMTYENLPAAE